jgi:putative ABC transport system permease protein
MRGLLQDLRYGARKLAKSPGFAAAVILTLAVSMGANSAIFSVVNAALLSPLPYPEADRLALIWESSLRQGLQSRPLSHESFAELSSQNKSFAQLSAYVASDDVGFSIADAGEPERVPGAVVSANFFATLGVEPLIGRAFAAAADNPAGEPVAVISERLWQHRFGADTGVAGRALRLNGRSYIVVGVMPAAVDFPAGAEVWVPGPLQADQAMNSALHITYSLRVLARLKPGVERDVAQSELNLIAQRLERAYPATNRGVEMRLVPLREEFYGDIRPTLLVLSGAVAFVLLIACANVANLLLARGAGRQHEIAIRAALGATRTRLARQLLTEYLLLSAMGGGLGLLLCHWLTRVLVALWPPAMRPPGEVAINLRVLGFTFATSLLAGLLFGLLPALRASRAGLNDSLKESHTRFGSGVRRHGWPSLIVVSEVAMALLLLVGAGLTVKLFVALTETKLGFDPRHVLTAKLTFSGRKYADRGQQLLFLQRVLERARTLPGVQGAGAVNFLPLSDSGFRTLFTIEGREAESGREPSADCVAVTPDYFNAIGVPLNAGRPFTEADSQNAPPVVIVDETMARRYWPDESPLGKRLNFQGSWREVVGIVRDVRQNSIGGPRQDAQVYVPYPQFGFTWPYVHLAVRGGPEDPSGLADGLRAAVRDEDREQPVESVTLIEQSISDSLSPYRFSALLLLCFACLALALAVIGVYGVTAYYVSQRTRDIGIRIALGARPSNVVWPLLRRGLTLTVAGIAVGTAGAFALTRVAASLMYKAGAMPDIKTCLLAALMLGAVTMLAVYIPARAATKVDPLTVLRGE